MVLPIYRHPDAVVVMSVATPVVIQISTGKLLCRPRRHQLLGAMCVASLDAIHLGIVSTLGHPHPMHNASKSLDLPRRL